MAKGKKYRKWYESHREEIESRPKQGVKPTVKLKKEEPQVEVSKKPLVLVHGFMVYECEKCGTIYEMYLEQGLEDRVQDKLDPKNHKPVPFIIGCRVCANGLAKHILWNIGDSDEYEELPEGASYFQNDPKEECGNPVIEKSYRNRGNWMKSVMDRKRSILTEV